MPLFELESAQELAAKEQAEEQLHAAAMLADLRVGRRQPELAVTQAQLAQVIAAEEQAAKQLERARRSSPPEDIAEAQLESSHAYRAIQAAPGSGSSAGQVEVSRLPAREDQVRAPDRAVAAARAAQSQAAGS